jgi:dTDP-4-amino-4,6-dideoxygalactose transaminase
MIPFLDLKAQYRGIKSEIDAAVLKVLESCQYILGPEVKAFEDEFAAFCHAKFAIGLNTGTSALHLSLLAAGIGPGDEVITVPFTFVATVAAIRYAGAKPVFVDIEPRSFTMDPKRIEAAITPKTKAIIPVHLYGQPADLDPIVAVAKKNKLVVIEDACQGHDSEYKGRRVGSIGELGCFSFYPGKNLGADGEGGAVVTNNEDYARKIRMYRDWGQERKYEHVVEGFNYRMDGIQGAILRVKLRHLKKWTEGRRANAARYNKLLGDAPVGVPEEMSHGRHVYHIYAIRTRDRSALQAALTDKQVQTAIHYPYPVHLLEAHRDLGYKAGQFPHSESAAREVLSLPMFPELTEEQVETVAKAVRESALRG